MGRRSPNYKKEILLEIIRGIMPAGSEERTRVAQNYQLASGEAFLRDYADIKRHFIQKMCNSNKKVTGESSASKLTEACQEVYNSILRKEGAGNYSGLSRTSTAPTSSAAFTAMALAASNSDSSSEKNTEISESENGDSVSVDSNTIKVTRAVSSGAQKSKNSRPKTPRARAAGALGVLADAVKSNSEMSMMKFMMELMASDHKRARKREKERERKRRKDYQRLRI